MIKHTMGPSFFITLSIAEAIFICLFAFLKMPVKIRDTEEEEPEEEQKPFIENLKSTMKLLVSPKMVWLAGVFYWSGASIAYFNGMLIPIMDLQQLDTGRKEKERISYALLGMVAFGFGEVFGGFLHGMVIDKLGSKRSCYVNTFFMCIMTATALISINNGKYNYLSYIMCFFWGWNDGVINIFMFQMMGFEFPNPADAFSVWNMYQGVCEFLC